MKAAFCRTGRYTFIMLAFKLSRQIALCLCLLLGLSACATVPPSKSDDVCAIFKEKRGWYRAAKAAERKWGAPLTVPMAIIQQESGFRHKARPPRRKLFGFIPWKRQSTAFGYAQAVNGTWAAYQRSTGEHWRERTDFADATDFVQWYLDQAHRRNGVAKTNVYDLYLNYHEGMAGFANRSHTSKPWLHQVALSVQDRAEAYAGQYTRCKADLKPGFFRRLLGW